MCLVKVGCCGFPVARQKYFNEFKLVEVQQTFYKLPQESTLRRWREEAVPETFGGEDGIGRLRSWCG